MKTALEIAWAAGFLEGEGSFGVARYKKRPWTGSAIVAAVQKQREPLARLHALFGGNDPKQYFKAGPTKDKSVWQWRVYGATAIGVMLTVYTFMSSRRKGQIRDAVVSCRFALGKSGTLSPLCRNGHPRSEFGARLKTTGTRYCRRCCADSARRVALRKKVANGA